MDIPDTKKFHSAVSQIETRASGMVWGPRSIGPALIFRVYEKVPPARKVPYNPSISQLAYAIPPTPWVRRLHVGFSRSEGFTDGGVQKFWLVSGECRFAVATSGSDLSP